MSRASKVYYLSVRPTGDITADINTQIGELPQSGDIAVDISTNTIGGITTDITNHLNNGEVYQFDSAYWNILTNRETAWTDQNIISNVTKVRSAHTGEIRNFINFIQRTHARRYGETWYNKHNMSAAILYWGSNTDFARIYMANYGADMDYLTIECGDDSTDKIKFVNRISSTSNTIQNIFDISPGGLTSYVPVIFNENLIISKDLFVILEAEFSNNVHMLSDLDVDGTLNIDTALVSNGTSTLNGIVTLGDVLYPKTGQTKGIKFTGVTRICEGATALEIASANQINLIAQDNDSVKINDNKIMHTGNGGHGSGFDADKLDGHEWSEIVTALEPVGTSNIIFEKVNGSSILDFDLPPGTWFINAESGFLQSAFGGGWLKIDGVTVDTQPNMGQDLPGVSWLQLNGTAILEGGRTITIQLFPTHVWGAGTMRVSAFAIKVA